MASVSERENKLAAARRKLKQFQEKQSRSHTPRSVDEASDHRFGGSVESLAESSVSLPNYSENVLKEDLNRSGSGFVHDEHRSPFQRVNIGNSTNTIVDIPNSNIYLPPSNSTVFSLSPKTIDHESTYTSIATPFTVPVYDSTASTAIPSISDYFSQSNSSDNSPFIPAAQPNSTLLPPSGPRSTDDPINNYVYSSNNALTGMEADVSSQVVDNDSFNKNSSAPVNAFDGVNQYDLSFDANRASVTVVTDAAVVPVELPDQTSMIEPNYYQEQVVNNEINRLKNDLAVQIEYCQNITGQLTELQTHYKNLHEAYTTLNAQTQQSQTSVVNQVQQRELALQGQVHQYMQTVSVLIDEKHELESQLRNSLDSNKGQKAEMEEMRGRLQSNRERVYKLEQDLKIRTDTDSQLRVQDSLTKSLKTDLEAKEQRLHDVEYAKNELSAKLKLRNESIQQLELKIEEFGNQLGLRDIHIQQLSGEGESNKSVGEKLQVDIARLQAENKHLRESTEHWKSESEQSRLRYETYSAKKDTAIGQLNLELDKAHSKSSDFEASNNALMGQISALKLVVEEKSNMPESGSVINSEQLSQLKMQLDFAEKRSTDLCSVVASKDAQLHSIEMALNEERQKTRNIHEKLSERVENQSDATKLLEELQNDRTALSRAIQQNEQLKGQLFELEDKFVKMTQDNAEMVNKLQSTEHSYSILKHQLENDNSHSETVAELTQLRQTAMQVEQCNQDKSLIEERMHHFETNYNSVVNELDEIKRKAAEFCTENEALRQQCSFLTHEKVRANRHADSENLHLKTQTSTQMAEIDDLKSKIDALQVEISVLRDESNKIEPLQSELNAKNDELKMKQSRIDHLSSENNELHDLMDQNAEDENQNSIKIELQNALDRITQVLAEKRELNRLLEDQQLRYSEMESQLAVNGNNEDSYRLNGNQSPSSNSDDASDVNTRETPVKLTNAPVNSTAVTEDGFSVCSEHTDAISKDIFDKLKTAMEQLQERFTRAMLQNADLSEQNNQLEHLIVQLQGETDTIGEYITLYQHQRKGVRERIRLKDEMIATLSREKEQTQSKLDELQTLLMDVLHENGILMPYKTDNKITSKKRSPSGSGSVVGRSSSLNSDNNRRSRSLSQTSWVHNEMTGECADLSPVSTTADEGFGASEATSPAERNDPVLNGHSPNADVEKQPALNQRKLDQFSNDSANGGLSNKKTTDRILTLLNEMRRTKGADSGLSMMERSPHCRYCTGQLQVI